MDSKSFSHMDNNYDEPTNNKNSFNPDSEKHESKLEMISDELNPELDLGLQRTLNFPVENVWRAWTNPEMLKQWFCPKPWEITELDLDARPGGLFYFVMKSPEGEVHENLGCVLVADKNKRFVWTDAMYPGFRPAKAPVSGVQVFITAIIELESLGGRTQIKAHAKHRDIKDKKFHEDLGFYEGWNACLDQMEALLDQEQKLERARRFDADWYIDM